MNVLMPRAYHELLRRSLKAIRWAATISIACAGQHS